MGSKQSWEQRIDPATADIIKSFVEFLNCIEEPDKALRQAFLENIKDSAITSFKPFYKKNEQETKLVDLMKCLSSQNGIDQEVIESEINKIITPDMLIYLSFQSLNFICVLLEKKSLLALCKEAREGNEKALFKLLRYDKTLVDHEWFRELIFAKALVADSIFFEKLGDAIKHEPTIAKHEQRKLIFIIVSFWPAVFSKLTYAQQMELLDHIGLEIPFSPDTYKKLIQRRIKPLFKTSQ